MCRYFSGEKTNNMFYLIINHSVKCSKISNIKSMRVKTKQWLNTVFEIRSKWIWVSFKTVKTRIFVILSPQILQQTRTLNMNQSPHLKICENYFYVLLENRIRQRIIDSWRVWHKNKHICNHSNVYFTGNIYAWDILKLRTLVWRIPNEIDNIKP